eukprot:3376055-Rhodomonas_salina.3
MVMDDEHDEHDAAAREAAAAASCKLLLLLLKRAPESVRGGPEFLSVLRRREGHSSQPEGH